MEKVYFWQRCIECNALEICQDLRWSVPDWIAVPCGNGGNLTALLASLIRAKQRGLINKLPGIIVAQTKGANTLVRWAKSGFKTYKPGQFSETVASAMNIQNPVSFPRIAKLYKNFNIQFFDVKEEEINKTRMLFMSAGANICPQSAVALNAVLQAKDKGIVKESDVVVSIGTASGVKFSISTIKHFSSTQVIDGTISAIDNALML